MSKPDSLARILVLDDDPKVLGALVDTLVSMGYEAKGVSEPVEALGCLRSWGPEVLISDLKMPVMNGMEVARKAHEIIEDLPVIILTGYGTIESAVQSMRSGVYDYLLKPFEFDEVDLTLQRAIDHIRCKRRSSILAESMGRTGEFKGIVGESASVRTLLNTIGTVASTDSTVLVVGESGTGKELVARAIHTAGPRSRKPFVTVDCAAMSESLLESELFGHARGAFTGAHRDKPGFFEVAIDGTIFLDEIGEISLSMQKKLLRVLEEKAFWRIGETHRRTTAARVVAATNRDLKEEMEKGRFREDLYYRLNVITVNVPALRDRSEDVPLLVRHYLEFFARKLSRRVKGISSEAMGALQCYGWPGNIRELVHLLEQMITFHDVETLGVEHLPAHLHEGYLEAIPDMSYEDLKKQAVEAAGHRYFKTLLRHYQGNVTRVAEHAGSDRRNIHRLLAKLNIDPNTFRTP